MVLHTASATLSNTLACASTMSAPEALPERLHGVRLQELFGVIRHPTAGGRPLRITLLSPGQKPIAVTTDLPGFWAGGYAEVRKDMRGRYPRHPWPENPLEADPTTRAKPRGT